jgi:hypothetical protein
MAHDANHFEENPMRRLSGARLGAVVVATTAIVAVTGAPALAATVTRVPVDAGTAGGIGGVDAVSTTDGWAVGSTGTDAVIRRFDGTRWRVVPSPSLADPSAPSGGTGLSAVDAVDTASANTAFAVGTRFGNGNAAVAVRWNGSAWSRSTVGRTTFTNSRLVAVKAFSATDAWAVGSQASTTTDHTLAMHFDGTSWTEVPVPSPGTRNSFLTSVSGVAPNDVWAVGYIQNLPYGNRIRLPLLLHWDGTTWTQVAAPAVPDRTSVFVYGVAAVSASDAWAVGWTSSATGSAYVARWNGSAWNSVPAPAMSSLTAVAARSSSDVWVAGFDPAGQSAVAHWNGAGWTVTTITVTGGPGLPSLSAIAAPAANTAWPVGSQSDQNTGKFAPLAFRVTA